MKWRIQKSRIHPCYWEYYRTDGNHIIHFAFTWKQAIYAVMAEHAAALSPSAATHAAAVRE